MDKTIENCPTIATSSWQDLESYFKSANQFETSVLDKIRKGETNLEKIKNNPLGFVRQLLGKDKAEGLLAKDIRFLVEEAEKIILKNEKMRKDAIKILEEESLRAGFVDEDHYVGEDGRVLKGDADALQDHINYGNEEDKS